MHFDFFVTKKQLKIKYKILIVFLFIIFCWMIRKPVLTALGRYLDMPSSTAVCDVVVVEGGPTVARQRVEAAVKLYKTKQANFITITLTGYDNAVDVFALKNYTKAVMKGLDSLGVPQNSYLIKHLKIKDPFTYNTARALAPEFKDRGFTSLLIINDNFHIRRSYRTFKHVMKAQGISVHPYTVPIYIDATNWWLAANGWRRVFSEYLKLAFYGFKGYLD